jgi:hypothetical protein
MLEENTLQNNDFYYSIEMNITARYLQPNVSPSLLMHAKSAQSVNYDINTRVLNTDTSRIVGFKKKIGSLSERNVPVIFISMAASDILLLAFLQHGSHDVNCKPRIKITTN